jgi:hypothetical protein
MNLENQKRIIIWNKESSRGAGANFERDVIREGVISHGRASHYPHLVPPQRTWRPVLVSDRSAWCRPLAAPPGHL